MGVYFVTLLGLSHQRIGLLDLIGCLFQPPLRLINPPVAVVNVALHVAQVVKLETPFALLLVIGILILVLESFVVDFGTRTEILFRIGKQVVWTGTADVGLAGFGVGNDY